MDIEIEESWELTGRGACREKRLEDKGSSADEPDKDSDEEENGETNGNALITPTSATAASFPSKEEPGLKSEDELQVVVEPEPQELAPTPIRSVAI